MSTISSLQNSVRSYLFVPGDRPERFDKAWGSQADALILDLEDAVLPSKKVEARNAIANWLVPEKRVWIRINPVDTQWFADDIQLLSSAGVEGVILPKAESFPEELQQLVKARNLSVIPLIETALGLDSAREMASASGVLRLAFGSIDFQVDTGIEGDDDALLYARSHLVHVSRLANIGRPVDGVTSDIQSRDRLVEDTRRSRRLGYGAKLCIHPSQIETVHEFLSPSLNERDWAEEVLRVMGAGDTGALTVRGKMVDAPVVKKAERIVSLPRAEISIRFVE